MAARCPKSPIVDCTACSKRRAMARPCGEHLWLPTVPSCHRGGVAVTQARPAAEPQTGCSPARLPTGARRGECLDSQRLAAGAGGHCRPPDSPPLQGTRGAPSRLRTDQCCQGIIMVLKKTKKRYRSLSKPVCHVWATCCLIFREPFGEFWSKWHLRHECQTERALFARRRPTVASPPGPAENRGGESLRNTGLQWRGPPLRSPVGRDATVCSCAICMHLSLLALASHPTRLRRVWHDGFSAVLPSPFSCYSCNRPSLDSSPRESESRRDI